MELLLSDNDLFITQVDSEETLEKEELNASSVINSLLKSLCLEEFPCGSGSWRTTANKTTADDIFQTTTKNYPLQHEKIEVLEKYLNSGTWDVDTSWSSEVADLRKIAVQKPAAINDKFICSYFKTLRLISKGITKVDDDILKFKNLEELTLTVNKLTSVPSKLPATLKILELSTNDIADLSSLQSKKMLLLHLGLSYNYLVGNSQNVYLKGDVFPKLMSLDLSYNILTDLVDLIEKSSTLPKLKNLTLLGNPFSLIPGYRGFVIDSLRNLQIFDDHHISADEKHHFKGLARRKENVLDEAYISIALSTLKGLPMPEELIENPERPEFPIITTTYFVQYQMPPNSNDVVDSPDENKMVNFDTEKQEWEETGLNLKYRTLHCVDNLILLKQIFQHGIKFSIIEERTESWPITELDRMVSAVPVTPKKKDSVKGKDTPQLKKGKDTPKGKPDKGKKKPASKSSGEDMESDPPIYKQIGDYQINIEKFLDGVNDFELNCYCGGGPIPEVTIVDMIETSSKSKVMERNKSQKSVRKGSGGKKSKGEERTIPEDETPKPPPPILLQINVNLKRWTTAADSVKPFS